MILNDLFESNIFIPKGNLNISREKMPQISEEDQEIFFKYLKDHGVKITKTKILAKDLKPTQKTINLSAVNKLLKTNSSKLKKPIIVSSDNYVIDGHHRWLAALNKNRESKVNVIKSSIPVKQLIKIIKGFDKVVFKDNENKILDVS